MASRIEKDPPDFRLLFESAPGLHLVLEPDFTIVAVSNAYLRATMTQRDAIVGRGLFEIFPDNPQEQNATGENNLRASLNRVLASRAPDVMAIQKYDIRRPESEGGGFEARYWGPINSPVFGPSGDVIHIIHRVEDVTDFARLVQKRDQEDAQNEKLRVRAEHIESEILLRGRQLDEANRKLRAANQELERLREEERIRLMDDIARRGAELDAIIESLPDGVYIGTHDHIVKCNSRALELVGLDNLMDLNRALPSPAAPSTFGAPRMGKRFQQPIGPSPARCAERRSSKK